MFQNNSESESHNGEHTTTNTTPAEVRDTQPAADDTRFLDHLVAWWASHRRTDLDLSHLTGVQLNEQFGPPTSRQSRGDGVLKPGAERLAVSVSELSRMRAFAARFVSPDEFVQKYKVKNWAEAKALLRTPGGGDAPKPKQQVRPGKNAKRTATRCRKRLVTLTKLLGPVEANALTPQSTDEWRNTLEAFAEVVSVRLGIVVTVAGVREESGSEEVEMAVTAG